MQSFIVFLLATFGLTKSFQVALDDIAEKLNDGGRQQWANVLRRKPFICTLCMGFYFGFALSLGCFHDTHIFTHTVNAWAASAFCWTANRFVTGDF